MDLSQVPRGKAELTIKYLNKLIENIVDKTTGPIGAPGDPLADPYDDPSYSFSFRTADHQRREDADSAGRVRGE